MPELPEVETVKTYVHERVLDKKIKNISLDFTINLLNDKLINNYFNWNNGCLA